MPSQYSGGSQGLPSDARQTTAGSLGTTASSGHNPLEPVQLSATSQTPSLARHVVVAGAKPSTQVLAVPLQESVPSQGPPLEPPTQVVVADAKPSAGQVPDVPLQLSATSH
jgi:hypothetical protein